MKNLTTFILLFVLSSFSMNTTPSILVSGQVFDDQGLPIPGVTVIEKSTVNGTTTDIDGKYELEVASEKSVLVFSMVGMQSKEVSVNGKATVNVTLHPETSELSEVVVTGVSKSRKKLSLGNMFRSAEKSAGYGPVAYEMDDSFANPHNTEEYDFIEENIFRTPQSSPLSTFSIDVDNASYTNVRRMINHGQKPLADAVRIEEMINYFSYDYKQPTDALPFSINTEVSQAPWNDKHQLVHIGIQGKRLDTNDIKPSNLVFLVDVSGSMSSRNKLPLLKSSLKVLINRMSEKDKIAIVAYAGAAGLVLPSTPASQKRQIIQALDNLQSGGSTAGGAGIRLAYQVATDNFIEDGNNRVILATDGDFNVGISSSSEMVRMIKEKAKSGVFLTITGFGMGNYKDGRMEQISNAGNGNYYYIDSYREATKVFGTEMQATMFTIAKDVKIQVEFNPQLVQAYRLIGYENRKLKAEDFNDDKIDAGELGAGHTVTALYEIIPHGVKSEFIKDVDQLKYQQVDQKSPQPSELMTVKLRYKEPDGSKSKLITNTIDNQHNTMAKASHNLRFSAAVAQFGMLLRDSEFKQNATLESCIELAKNSKGDDAMGYRQEFVQMIRNYSVLSKESH